MEKLLLMAKSFGFSGSIRLKSKSSPEKTQASYLSTLCNNLATVSQNEEIAYVLSGDDFDFR